MIWENILRRFNAVGVLTKNVRVVGLSNTQKSSFYRSILIILHTIVEGLVYEIVKKNTISPNHYFDDSYKYSEICKIKSTVLQTNSDVHLYRKEKFKLKISDEGATFVRLNLFLKHHQIITEQQYNSIEWVRRERNKLHIQGLNDHDTNYTEAKVKRTAKIIKFLMTKV